MKKIVLFLILFVIVLNGCQVQEAKETEEDGLQAVEERGLLRGEILPARPSLLSDIQITACNEADKAGTCDSRLAELGIVMKEECCEVLNKCC